MFNTTEFLRANFGSVDGLLIKVARHGDVPQREAVSKWFQRKSIPSEWLPVLLHALEREAGEPVSLEPYVEGGSRGGDVFA